MLAAFYFITIVISIFFHINFLVKCHHLSHSNCHQNNSIARIPNRNVNFQCAPFCESFFILELVLLFSMSSQAQNCRIHKIVSYALHIQSVNEMENHLDLILSPMKLNNNKQKHWFLVHSQKTKWLRRKLLGEFKLNELTIETDLMTVMLRDSTVFAAILALEWPSQSSVWRSVSKITE